MLMGDNWIKTILRVVTPNACSTLLELFRYYFVNAMVIISAVIFIAGTRTMVMTTKIKELQSYYPIAIYKGENTEAENLSANPKVFSEPLTAALLEQHQALSEYCK